MHRFIETLNTLRWDDHRYYHLSIVNQSLHFLSATSFLFAYVVLFWDPALAALIAWMISMTSRQAGHFFFEPKGYDQVNQVTHEFKESVKVGYNLRRKVVLHALWLLAPVMLYLEPSVFGLMRPWDNFLGFFHNLGTIWLFLGAGALVFRTVHLFFLEDVLTGVVWAVKIISDPFHDLKLYYKAPVRLLRGDTFDGVALHHGR